MRLEKLQAYLRDKGQEYQYVEEDGCGSIDWEYRGLTYHVWELPGSCAESNVRIARKMEEYKGNYEEQIINIMERWG